MTGGFGLWVSWVLVERVSAAAHEATWGPVTRAAGTNLRTNKTTLPNLMKNIENTCYNYR